MSALFLATGNEIKEHHDDISDRFQDGDPLIVRTVDNLAKLIYRSRTEECNIFRTRDQDDDHGKAEWYLAEYCAFNKVEGIRPENPKEQCFWYHSKRSIRMSPAQLAQAIFDDYISRITGGYERLVGMGDTCRREGSSQSLKTVLVELN